MAGPSSVSKATVPPRRLRARSSMLVHDVLFDVFSHRYALSPGDLASAALVHSSWLNAASYWLYKSVNVTLPNNRFARTMWESADLRALVRRLSIQLYWPFQAQLCAYLVWGDRNELIYSFSWMLLQGVSLTHLCIDTGIHWAPAVAVMGILEGSCVVDGLDHLRLRGMHLQFEIPAGLKTLDLVGSSFFRFHRIMPPGLHSLRIVDVTRLPLPFLKGVAGTLTRLEIHLSPMYRNTRGIHAQSWTWPEFSALQHLVISSSRGENLHLGKLHPTILTISHCLFETNQIPPSATRIEVDPPGMFTSYTAHFFLLQKGARRLRCKRIDLWCLVSNEAVALLRDSGLEVNVYYMMDRPHAPLYD